MCTIYRFDCYIPRKVHCEKEEEGTEEKKSSEQRVLRKDNIFFCSRKENNKT